MLYYMVLGLGKSRLIQELAEKVVEIFIMYCKCYAEWSLVGRENRISVF